MTTTTTVTCYKCHGARYFDKFSHIVSGVCFTCGGAGVVDIDSSKLESRTKSADAGYSERPYTVIPDGAECISVTFQTWEAARDWLGDGKTNDFGEKFRIAKWDGKCHRYRDGTKVRFHHHR